MENIMKRPVFSLRVILRSMMMITATITIIMITLNLKY